MEYFKNFEWKICDIDSNLGSVNSMLSEHKHTTTICTLPLISGSPIDWSTLSNALRLTKDMLDFIKIKEKNGFT